MSFSISLFRLPIRVECLSPPRGAEAGEGEAAHHRAAAASGHVLAVRGVVGADVRHGGLKVNRAKPGQAQPSPAKPS